MKKIQDIVNEGTMAQRAMLLVAAPFLGLAYAVFLPFIGIAMVVGLGGAKLMDMVGGEVAKHSTLQWNPVASYLSGGKRKKTSKTDK